MAFVRHTQAKLKRATVRSDREPSGPLMKGRVVFPRSGSMRIFIASAVWTLLALAAPVSAAPAHDSITRALELTVARAAEAPLVDGRALDPSWSAAAWHAIDRRWLGHEFTGEDFRGRYKVLWSGNRLYLLVEIVDDVLYDGHRDPLVQYWDDDCLEVFIDEDFSGGEHHSNHNAFAYHFSLDNRAVDIGQDGQPREYTEHVESRWRQGAGSLMWEVSIAVFDDSYTDDDDSAEPVQLHTGKVLGLMVAYCDNDGSKLRENFIGSVPVSGGEKDRGYMDADIFAKITLTEFL